MVEIVDYKQLENKKGESFFALVLQGDIEIVVSKQSGRQYITAPKASLPCTFTESVCQSLIGKNMPGSISRDKCDPYEYTTSEGQVLTLDYTYVYKEQVEKATELKPVHHENGMLQAA